MTKIGFKNSGFGFLEAYRAKNIASIKPSLLNNLEEIKYNLGLLLDHLKKDKAENQILVLLERCKNKLYREDDIIEIANSFGDTLQSSSELFNHINRNKSKEAYIIMKRIIYNYVEFAKKSEESKLLDLAKKIANNLDF